MAVRVGAAVSVAVTAGAGAAVGVAVGERDGVLVGIFVGDGVLVTVSVVGVMVGETTVASTGRSVSAAVPGEAVALASALIVGDATDWGTGVSVANTAVGEGDSPAIGLRGVAVPPIGGVVSGVAVGDRAVAVGVTVPVSVGVGDAIPTSVSCRARDIAPARIITTTPTTAMPSARERQSNHRADSR